PYNADGPHLQHWNRVYDHLTRHGCSKRPVLAGCGGAAGEAYAWAIANPDKVACIYAASPVLRCTMTKQQPLDGLQVLAKSHVKILHSSGSQDPLLEGYTRAAEHKYRDLGGELVVLINEGEGHYPTKPRDVPAVVKFVIENSTKK